MTPNLSVQERVAAHYQGLSNRLQEAADYVVANPVEIATRSLRFVSKEAGFAPATLTRLARALDFDSYEDMRDLCRGQVARRRSHAERAEQLRHEAGDEGLGSFFHRQIDASKGNLDKLLAETDGDKLEQTVAALGKAKNVLLYGAFSSTGITEYFGYLANFLAPGWKIAGRLGASLSTSVVDLDEQDAFIVITKAPFARKSLVGARMAAERDAFVLVITDSHSCPALDYATVSFITPSESPQFFSSYAATLVLIETIIGMLVAKSGEDSTARFEEIEARNRDLGDFWE